MSRLHLSLFSLLVNLGWLLFPVLGPEVLGSVVVGCFFRVLLFLLSVLSALDVAGRICSNRFRSCCAWIQSFELSLSFLL